ncbi:MAG: class I SAM-dependent methyltransferase [Parachlamydiaceae bacterium]|nr:class I SAM-dependent methyltransferase [Parachlamydiaceae bacterium]
MKIKLLVFCLWMMKNFSFCSIFVKLFSYFSGNLRYLANRLPMSDKRFPSFLVAINLLEEKNTKVLIETGTARDGDANFFGDGGSTIIFGDWAKQNKGKFYSVDIDPEAVTNAQKATKVYGNNVDVVCANAIEFLANFNQPIDFLYLDSFDFEYERPWLSQEHHLFEIEAALPKLHKNSIVMIDDCGLAFGGKGKLVVAKLLEKGWKKVFDGYQVILAR